MRLLEHQAKTLIGGFGVSFTGSSLARTPEAAVEIAARIGTSVVLKAQVPFGGRGKVGAVQFAHSPTEVERLARELLGMRIRGETVDCLSVEPKVLFLREYYLGIAWDTSAKLPIALLSDDGGVEVEHAARIVRRTFDPWTGLQAFVGREMAAELGVQGHLQSGLGQTLARLAAAFLASDALTMEINPMVERTDGTLIGLDAHVELDDDGLARQGTRLRPLGESGRAGGGGRPPTHLEVEAQKIDAMDHRGVAGRLVEFEGDLGLLIGGGGASLTVFDAVRRHKGTPANYCEVGGNPTEEKVAALTALLLTKPRVQKLAVIMNVVNNTRADVMARGVIEGAKRAGRVPAEAISVFRVPGSWEQEARTLLAAEGIEALGREVSLDEAARYAVERNASRAP
jgi:succinyl-CoA synthetase beta subunit/citryl-CoA synthetase large subunit